MLDIINDVWYIFDFLSCHQMHSMLDSNDTTWSWNTQKFCKNLQNWTLNAQANQPSLTFSHSIILACCLTNIVALKSDQKRGWKLRTLVNLVVSWNIASSYRRKFVQSCSMHNKLPKICFLTFRQVWKRFLEIWISPFCFNSFFKQYLEKF